MVVEDDHDECTMVSPFMVKVYVDPLRLMYESVVMVLSCASSRPWASVANGRPRICSMALLAMASATCDWVA